MTGEGLINRNGNYGGSSNTLKEPFLQKNTAQFSSNSNLLFGVDQPSPPDSSSRTQPNTPHNATQVNWIHRNRSIFSQVANNEPVDPNIVFIPKHPQYLSKLYRPDPKIISSTEAFGTLRVETIALCCLLIVTAAIFAPEHFSIIVLLTLGCILCIIGFIGALRKKKLLLQIFLVGIAIWFSFIIVVVFAILFASNMVKDDATIRCETAADYVLKYNKDPATGAIIDCATNMHTCYLNCIYAVEKHITVGYFVFSGVVGLCLVILIIHLYSQFCLLIFDEETTKKTDEDEDDEYDDDDDEDYENEDDIGNQPGFIYDPNQHFTTPIQGQVLDDDIIVTTSNPLQRA